MPFGGWQSWVGKTVEYESPEELGRAAIRYYETSIEDPTTSGRIADRSYSRSTEAIPAPPTLICETLQIYGLPRRDDGFAGHDWGIPLPADWSPVLGEHQYEFHGPVLSSDTIRVKWTILDIYQRETKSAGKRVFVLSEGRYYKKKDELVAVSRETVVWGPRK